MNGFGKQRTAREQNGHRTRGHTEGAMDQGGKAAGGGRKKNRVFDKVTEIPENKPQTQGIISLL